MMSPTDDGERGATGRVDPQDERNAAADALSRAAHALPRAIEPPVELWTGVQQAIAARQVHEIGARSGPGAPGTAARATMVTIGVPRWALQVAASLLLFATGAALVYSLRGPQRDEPAHDVTALTAVKATPAQATAMLLTLDQYEKSEERWKKLLYDLVRR